MNREEKAQYIDDLAAELSTANVLYLTDTAELTVESVNALRRRCFQTQISLKVVKNALLKKAMDRVEGRNYGELKGLLKGSTSIMISQEANAPARLIQEFRKKNAKPILKGAYVEEAIFIGDNQLITLEFMKSKDELIGEIIGLLQSPAKNVVSGLKGAGAKIAGILKTLEEK
ncbi:MAG: 50S ribosomal protein L10 [Flavobacteriia bacterium]|jgi:large subunit ribosomal protein L10|nr:50S ribosomal protein L10 [Flavobacteriia bacterium]NBX39805.1 50S ribosomal protein L10 [Flavobacteriia bacterium]